MTKMVKLKFDVRDSDPTEAAAKGDAFEKPKPGLYRFKIKEANLGFTKGDDGKPDKAKPYVEVVFQCDDSRYKGAQVWAYFVQPGHPKYDKGAVEKWDQLLLALGISNGKKRTGDIDTDKMMVDKFVTVRVRGGKDQSGEYRAEYGSVFPDGHGGTSEGSVGDDELLSDDGDEAMSEDDEPMADDDEMAGETDWDARREELAAAGVPDLKEIAKAYEIKITGMKKSEVVDALIEFEKSLPSGGDETIADDDDIMLDDDIEADEPATKYLTKEELVAMETAELISTAKDFDVVTKGKKKSEVITAILEAQAAPEDGDDGELPF